MGIRFDKAAEVLCEALALDPDGMRTEFLPSGPRSETFRDMHRGAAWAVLQFYRDCLQSYAESIPIENYGTVRPAVEWLDKQLLSDANARASQPEGENNG